MNLKYKERMVTDNFMFQWSTANKKCIGACILEEKL